MKKIFTLISVLLVCFLFTAATAKPDYSYYIKEFYDDIQADGNDSMLDVNGRIKRRNLPPEVLEDMDTETLVESLLNHPYFILHTMAFNTPEGGINSLRGRVTALAELESRTDAGEEVLKKYTKLKETDTSLMSGEEAARHSMKLKVSEALLCEKFVQAQLVVDHI